MCAANLSDSMILASLNVSSDSFQVTQIIVAMLSFEFDSKNLVLLASKRSLLTLLNQNISDAVGLYNRDEAELGSIAAATTAISVNQDLLENKFLNKSEILFHDGGVLLGGLEPALTFFLLMLSALLLCYPLKFLWEAWNLYMASDPSSPLSHLPLPPGEFGLPIVGETLQWITQGSNFNIFRRQKFGNIFKTNAIGLPMIRVTGHEYVKQILHSEHEKVTTIWPANVRRILGSNGLVNSIGAAHRLKRKIACKAFTTATLNSYIPLMQCSIRANIKDIVSSDEPRVYDKMLHLTYSLAASALLGIDSDSEASSELYEHFHTLISNIFSVPINLPGTSFNKALKARAVILHLLEDHITERKRTIHREIVKGEEGTEMKTAFDVIIREMIVQSLSAPKDSNGDDAIDDLTLKEIAIELMFAGYFTSGSALTSSILELSRNPQVFHKMEEELLDVGLMKEDHGATDEEVTQSEVDLRLIHKLTYMEQVLKETLRLRPPVLGGYRRARETFQLGKYRIPKGWTLVYNIRDTHEFEFESKQDFQPERFETKFESDDKYRFIPFGGGARMCIGREYARLIIKLTLVELLRSFKSWELVNPGLPKMKTIPALHPVDGLPCNFYPRAKEGVIAR